MVSVTMATLTREYVNPGAQGPSVTERRAAGPTITASLESLGQRQREVYSRLAVALCLICGQLLAMTSRQTQHRATEHQRVTQIVESIVDYQGFSNGDRHVYDDYEEKEE